ncbi:MAG TPA: DUF5678 domain-containing protein [Rhizomicrobium sp.]|jgi:hypothetical protein
MAKNNAAVVGDFFESNAEEIASALSVFRESARVFSSNRSRLIDQYENKWAAAHDGRIVAVADTVDSLLAILAENGVPANESMVRHIDREPKTLIL